VGRADDVITSAGYRIGPFEVENCLIEHPAVAESAVVGSGAVLRSKRLAIRSCGVGLGECLCLFVVMQVLQEKAFAAHRCAEGRSKLGRVIKRIQRLLVSLQINEDPRFANPGFCGLRIKAQQFIIGK
jgi:acyl-CoA synthetase (AMP-forming)/AMP-acid ligase II